MPEVNAKANLAEIQDFYYKLWTRRDFREDMLSRNLQINKSGVNLYASLIEIGRLDLMASVYPCISALLGRKFKDLVLAYYETMPADHYNLNRSASRFAAYIEQYEPTLISRHPFIMELAHFEWIELEVMEAESPNLISLGSVGKAGRGRKKVSQIRQDTLETEAQDFVSMSPRLADVVVFHRYQYPVMTISKTLLDGEKLPRRVKKETTNMAIYRDNKSHQCRFLELGEMAFEALQMVKAQPGITYGELLKAVCQSSSDSPEETVEAFLELLEELKACNLIVN
ncbi:MAG: DNA-binding domain-containing protein [Candidatus Obscuribacterales bacterium]|nr:DNA-binding domain-containing protein [Candidatus Obscuribacterales bacterium]